MRPAGSTEIVCWAAGTPEEEAEHIADTIARLHAAGHRYADIGSCFDPFELLRLH